MTKNLSKAKTQKIVQVKDHKSIEQKAEEIKRSLGLK